MRKVPQEYLDVLNSPILSDLAKAIFVKLILCPPKTGLNTLDLAEQIGQRPDLVNAAMIELAEHNLIKPKQELQPVHGEPIPESKRNAKRVYEA